MKAKEKRFLDSLESLFTGAEVDGESGFVNLMHMKHQYFQSVKPMLIETIDTRVDGNEEFREELFDKLYTFFSRYFCESGSIYFRHLPAFSKTYERVYTDGDDSGLVWKTRMLYYVKSDVLIRSMPVKITDSAPPFGERRFYFDASEIEHKQNNEKKEFVFKFQNVEVADNHPVVHLRVIYSKNGSKTDIESIIKKARNSGEKRVAISVEHLHKAFRVFTRQIEADFFINKDANGFLKEQFNLWNYQYLFNEESVFEQTRLSQLQALRDTAYDIIDLIAQFEDELRKVWEKPKFVRNVNYVVTLDKLPTELIEKIVAHLDFGLQITEWRQLGLVDEDFSESNLSRNEMNLNIDNGVADECMFLPLDSKYFPDLKTELLASLGELNDVVDGEIVCSENWQALNTLQKRFAGQIDCIHIDPPYNTQTSGFLYRNEYRHSSWLTMMENRVQVANEFLTDEGVFLCHIDEHENERLHLLMEDSGLIDSGAIVWDKGTPMTGGRGVANQHEYIQWWSNSDKYLKFVNKNFREILKKAEELVDSSEGDIDEELMNRFSSWVTTQPNFTGGETAYRFMDESGRVYRSVSLRAPEPRTNPKYFIPLVHPATNKECPVPPNGFSRTPETLKKMLKRGEILFGQDETTQPTQKRYLNSSSLAQVSSVIRDGRRGKVDLDKLGLANFPYCHSAGFYSDLLEKATDSNSVVLDYFVGSGTTGHAILALNRKDNGNRKFLLFELGEQFESILIPRIKKLIYSDDWQNGHPASMQGGSHLIKYYSLEQYEDSLRNMRYKDSGQLEIDSMKSPFAQYVFFGDAKLSGIVQKSDGDAIDINLLDLYPDIDIAESLSNVVGKHIQRISAEYVTFADGSQEKINISAMSHEEKLHFISLIKPYLWWGEH